MAYRLEAFSDVRLDEASLKLVLDEHHSGTLPRLDKLWTYFRNPLRPVGLGASADTWSRSGRWYRLAQEIGLPPRVVGERLPSLVGLDDRAAARREVVVENDIAWRIQTMIDFMFGKPVRIRSTAHDERTRELVERALDTILESSGGIALLQDMALLGHVFGHVDLIVNADHEFSPLHTPATDIASLERLLRGQAEGLVRVETIEPRRGIPVLDPSDYRRINAYVVHYHQAGSPQPPDGPTPAKPTFFDRILSRHAGPRAPRRTSITHVISPSTWRMYRDDRLVEQHDLRFLDGRLPVVHIQNLSQPFSYEGLSDVEPLIPLQDELNTRLSDRACRVTMQSFKMYLAKGIEGFDRVAVGPGQIWSTDNPDAEVKEFGGDSHAPSEESHILEIREALDKTSGVPPLASGVVRAKIGNLTSATALRITMMGLVAKTARKRVTYGRGIAEICRLILTALDSANVLRTDDADRAITIDWPDPIPLEERDLIANVRAKSELGVPRDRLLDELGHSPADRGIT